MCYKGRRWRLTRHSTQWRGNFHQMNMFCLLSKFKALISSQHCHSLSLSQTARTIFFLTLFRLLDRMFPLRWHKWSRFRPNHCYSKWTETPSYFYYQYYCTREQSNICYFIFHLLSIETERTCINSWIGLGSAACSQSFYSFLSVQ